MKSCWRRPVISAAARRNDRTQKREAWTGHYNMQRLAAVGAYPASRRCRLAKHRAGWWSGAFQKPHPVAEHSSLWTCTGRTAGAAVAVPNTRHPAIPRGMKAPNAVPALACAQQRVSLPAVTQQFWGSFSSIITRCWNFRLQAWHFPRKFDLEVSQTTAINLSNWVVHAHTCVCLVLNLLQCVIAAQ